MFANDNNRKNIIKRIINTSISFNRINHFLLFKGKDSVQVINPSPIINASIKNMLDIHESGKHKYSDKGNSAHFWKQLHSVIQFDNTHSFNYNLESHILSQNITIKTRLTKKTKKKIQVIILEGFLP